MEESVQRKSTQSGSRSRQYATFYVGDLFFGVEVLQVQEVLRAQEMTRVPRADSVVEGLINLRGQIVTAFDMRERLGLGRREGNKPPMNVVIRSEDGAISLLVDEIGDVIEIKEENFEVSHGRLALFASSPGVSRGFCDRCGSSLSYAGEDWPGQIAVLAATLDEPGIATPTANNYVEHKLPWVRLDDDLTRRERFSDD